MCGRPPELRQNYKSHNPKGARALSFGSSSPECVTPLLTQRQLDSTSQHARARAGEEGGERPEDVNGEGAVAPLSPTLPFKAGWVGGGAGLRRRLARVGQGRQGRDWPAAGEPGSGRANGSGRRRRRRRRWLSARVEAVAGAASMARAAPGAD